MRNYQWLFVLMLFLAFILLGACHREEEAPLPRPEKAEQSQPSQQAPPSPKAQKEEPSKDILVRTTTNAYHAAEEKPIIPPKTVVFKTKMGDVTFPHQSHSERIECKVCHGEGTPGKFALDKDSAHKLCRGCHEEKGAGPTKCPDCHKK
jgi:predicted CXXCH cytochrome family protein